MVLLQIILYELSWKIIFQIQAEHEFLKYSQIYTFNNLKQIRTIIVLVIITIIYSETLFSY